MFRQKTKYLLAMLALVLGASEYGWAQVSTAPDIESHSQQAMPDQMAELNLPDAPQPQPDAVPDTAQKSTAETPSTSEGQMQQQVKQRAVFMPMFGVSYVAHPAPMTTKQKYKLAFRGSIDPGNFAAVALIAGWNQATDSFHDYGQGFQGYMKRFGAGYADSFDGTMLSQAVLPSILHQDPRYFRKGSGNTKSRILYAVSRVVISKGDNGKWQPNYSNVLGNLAAGGISNAYYPSSDRGLGLTFERAGVVTLEGAASSLFNEFWPDVAWKFFHKDVMGKNAENRPSSAHHPIP